MTVYDVSNIGKMQRPVIGMRIGSPDQAFDLGSAHTCHLSLTNTTTSTWSYTGSVQCWVFSPGPSISFSAPNVAGGSTTTIDIPIQIETSIPPGSVSPYEVSVFVYVDSVEVFNEVLDSITISVSAPGVSASITWD